MKYINAKLIPYGTLLLGFVIGGILMFLISQNEINIEKTAYFMTVGVSITALFFGFYQARYTVQHNRLQLQPRLIVRNSNFTDTDPYKLFTMEIINNGLGPAEIQNAYYEINDTNERFSLDIQGLERYLHRVFANDYDHIKDSDEKLIAWLTNPGSPYFQENEGIAKKELIAAGTSRKVVSVSLPERAKHHYFSTADKEDMRNKARQALKNSTVIIFYKSLYGEEFVYPPTRAPE